MRSLRVLGSVIGATLLCALPVSPHLSYHGAPFAIERANAADLEVAPAHRRAHRHVQHVAYAEPYYEDPLYIAYCSGPYTGGGWNGGTYYGGPFIDMRCYGYHWDYDHGYNFDHGSRW